MNRTTLRLIKVAKSALEQIDRLNNPTGQLSDADREAIQIISMAIKYQLNSIDDEPEYIIELGGADNVCAKSVQRLQELDINEVDRKCYVQFVTNIYTGAE